MSGMLFIFIPTVVFLSIVAPIWLILHYWSKSKEKKGLSEQDQHMLEDIGQTIDTLTTRITHLEAILDEKHQGWRNHNH